MLNVTLGDVISFLGFVALVWQLRENVKQTKIQSEMLRESNKLAKLQSEIQVYDINRELMSQGYSKPELFEILEDAEGINPMLQRRFLQSWLNLMVLIHSFMRNGVFEKEVEESFDSNLRDMFKLKNMRRHWQKYGGAYYPASFRRLIDEILIEAGPEPEQTEAATS